MGTVNNGGSAEGRKARGGDKPARRPGRPLTPFQRGLRGFGRFVLVLCVLALIALAAGLFVINNAYLEVKKNIDQLVNTDLPEGSQATRIYARDYNADTGNGTLLGVVFKENRQSVSYEQIPPLLIACFLSTEDKDFYYHGGVDFKGTARALLNIVRRGGSVHGGGSTITQQLARNVYLPSIRSEKTLNRKIQEAIFANALEHRFTKQDIIEAYLNHSNLGGETHGVKAAARKYFAKDLADLNLSECALLAGMPQAPTSYNPYRHPEAAEARRQDVLKVLRRRVGTDFFKRLQEADPKKFKDFNISAAEIDEAAASPPKFKRTHDASIMRAEYFTSFMRDYVQREYGVDRVMNEGMVFVTTLDPQIQSWAEQIAKQKVSEWDKRGKRVSQCAVIVMDAHSGEVLADVGGYEWHLPNKDGVPDELNRAFISARQVGSSFKPFVYSTAYEQGFPVNLVLRDAPLKRLPNGKLWPTNSEGSYSGMVSIFYALQKSKNAAAVDLANNFTGIPAVIETARRMGITADLPEVESLPLGVASIRPLEMASAFTSFPNMGRHVKASLIRRVYSQSGIQLESNDGESAIAARSNQAISAETAWKMIKNMRRCVVNGTGARARAKAPSGEITVCGKTGTCEDFSDAWFCGYTPELVCVVWVGNDDYNKKMRHMFGGECSADIFGTLMKKIYSSHAAYTKLDFTKPAGVKFVDFPAPVTGGAIGAEKDDEAKKEDEKKAEDGKSEDEKNDDSGFYKQWQPPKDGDVFF